MTKVTRAVPHLSEEEIFKRIKQTRGFWRVQKWLAILIATVDPCPAVEIARHTGLAEQTIHNLISSYNRLGHSAHLISVYRLLKRHRWRKIVPRPEHVGAREESQDEFKKNSLK